jgi:hypothetical protein
MRARPLLLRTRAWARLARSFCCPREQDQAARGLGRACYCGDLAWAGGRSRGQAIVSRARASCVFLGDSKSKHDGACRRAAPCSARARPNTPAALGTRRPLEQHSTGRTLGRQRDAEAILRRWRRERGRAARKRERERERERLSLFSARARSTNEKDDERFSSRRGCVGVGATKNGSGCVCVCVCGAKEGRASLSGAACRPRPRGAFSTPLPALRAPPPHICSRHHSLARSRLALTHTHTHARHAMLNTSPRAWAKQRRGARSRRRRRRRRARTRGPALEGRSGKKKAGGGIGGSRGRRKARGAERNQGGKERERFDVHRGASWGGDG